ncbi:MAG: hypothetical protein K2L05_01325 [Muribaculaceae bacterium]|nr:hypothetical protein [Muribaculaceae bacterium]
MEDKAQKVTRRWWKWPAIIVGSLAGLVLAILVAIPLVFTPERLTRWVRDYGTEYLVDGRVEVARVDLSVWSTFPHAVLTVDSLRVDNLAVPADYREVLGCERIEGRLNLAALLLGRISVGHAQLSRLQATLWFGADSLQSSLSILPPSESEPSDEPLSLPDLYINRFVIAGDARVRYVSEPDSIDAAVVIRESTLYGWESSPDYVLTFDGLAQLPHELMAVDSLNIMLDGSIGWRPAAPLSVELVDFTVAVDSIETCTSLKADFSDGLRLDELQFRLLPVGVQHLASLVRQVPELITPATLSARAELRSPYTYNPDTLLIPDLKAELLLDNAPLEIPQWYLKLNNVALELLADLSPAGPDASKVELKRLNVQFPASDFTLSGDATNLLTDPEINGCFQGKLDFTNLNPRLWTLLGMRLRGVLDADVDLASRLSDLNMEGIHNARLTGEATLRNFQAVMPADTMAFAARRAKLTFGSANGFGGIDSLLTASLRVDTLKTDMPGMRVKMADISLSVGVKNLSTLEDTTIITPMGGRLKVKSLRYEGADSTRARIGDLDGMLSLTRFKHGAKSPRLGSRLTAKRLSFASGPTLTSLRGIDIAATAYSQPRDSRQKQRPTRADSLRRVARRDSILRGESGIETLDFGIDRSLVTLLKRWNLQGHVKAKSGGMVTPLFPLRMRLRNLDLGFSADSVNLRSLKLIAGRSDLSLDGSITNIQRALGRRRASAPLTLNLNLAADTLNINQLTQAAFRGAAYAAKTDSLSMVTASLDVDAEAAGAEAAGEEEMMAIVVPMNIDATVNLAARNIIYSNLALKDFGGQILVANGTANLRDLHASTDIGSVDLNMLYYAPTLSDVNFGLGLDLRRFNIGRVTELIPSLDTIMPILNTLGGIVDVGITATTPVDSMLNVKVPELRAMLELSGDSLRVLDEQTFKTISKWLFFHDKKKNLIDHMDVRLTVEDNRLSLYPFMFDFDRYRIGVMGHNDLDMNLDYHVSVLRSPIPFKFGVNIKGTADKMKIRLGRARFKEKMAAESTALADTVRLNLAREMRNVFARGAKAARLGPLDIRRPDEPQQVDEAADTLSASELLQFPDSVPN